MSYRYQNPLNSLSKMHDELNRLISPKWLTEDASTIATSKWVPEVDIIEKPESYIILMDVPGVDPKEIELYMEDGALAIKGIRHFSEETKDKGYHRVERQYGEFYRRFSLPESADLENISAKGQNGVLEIIIPKVEKVKSRRINIVTEV